MKCPMCGEDMRKVRESTQKANVWSTWMCPNCLHEVNIKPKKEEKENGR